jgi:hypothetical protein
MKSPKNCLIGLLGLALLGAGGLLWRENSIVVDLRTKVLAASEAQQREQRLLALEQRARAADARAADARARELEARTHELESQLADAKRAAAAAMSAVPPTPATQTNPLLAVAGDASTSRAQAARMRPKMERQYGALAKQLGLNAAQTDQFMKLLVDKQLASADATAAAMQAGDKALNDPTALAMLEAASRNAIEAQIQSLLGDSGYSQYLQAVRVTGQTNTLGRLQAALMGTEPLNDAQLGQLQQVLDANHINHISDKVMADTQAQGFLTPAQMKALQNLFQEQQAGQARRRAP